MPGKKVFALALFCVCLFASASPARAQSDERARAAAEIESLREQIRAREAALLSVPREDEERYADFLSRPGTGLVRLLPRERWDNKLSTRGGGSYYSFHAPTHEYGDVSDIGLEQGQFRVGFHGPDFGFIHTVGDVPLDEVTLEHPSVRFLDSFAPPSTRAEVDRLWGEYAAAGLRSGEFVYVRSAPALAGKTYVLRSVSYGDADSLVAFRVLRKDADDSVVILWKMLKEFPKPKLSPSAAADAASR